MSLLNSSATLVYKHRKSMFSGRNMNFRYGYGRYIVLILGIILFSCSAGSDRSKAEKLYEDGLSFASQAEQLMGKPGMLESESTKREYRELHDKAIAQYKDALRADASYAEPPAAAARSYEVTGRFEEAIQACKKAISLAPKEAEYYRQIGYCFCQNMEADKGIAALRQAVRLDTTQAFRISTADKLSNIALLLYIQSRFNKTDTGLSASLRNQAVSVLELGHEIDPGNEEIAERKNAFTE